MSISKSRAAASVVVLLLENLRAAVEGSEAVGGMVEPVPAAAAGSRDVEAEACSVGGAPSAATEEVELSRGSAPERKDVGCGSGMKKNEAGPETPERSPSNR